MITIHLPEELESHILAAVRDGRFTSLDDALIEAARRLVQDLGRSQAAAGSSPPSEKPIWELIEEENRSIPPEVWNALPRDLAEQHDHYVYGSPKRRAE